LSSDALPKNTALIIVDVQKGFDDPTWGRRNNPCAEDNMAKLLNAWRSAGCPIFHIRHRSRLEGSPLSPASSGFEIKEIVKPLPTELVIEKEVNSAFIGTDLEEQLRNRGIGAVVIVGLTTDHCVSTTARMAGNLGFETYVISDATATFDRYGPGERHFDAEEVHAVSLASLSGEFARILETADILGCRGRACARRP
jgi:nicotinamidase-related amidase